MIKNYLRVALRTFLKNKSYVVINALVDVTARALDPRIGDG